MAWIISNPVYFISLVGIVFNAKSDLRFEIHLLTVGDCQTCLPAVMKGVFGWVYFNRKNNFYN